MNERPGRAGVVGAALVTALAAASGAACSIGEGTGRVIGPVRVIRCYGENPDGSPRDFPRMPGMLYDMGADFFVGEPVDSPSVVYYPHSLLLRIQNAGVRPEFADLMSISLLDLYQAGRCVSGRTDAVTGAPDWEAAFCDHSTGMPRLLVGTESEVARAHLELNRTCAVQVGEIPFPTPASADALGDCASGTCPPVEICPGRGSWITFAQLGGVRANSGVAVSKNSYKVNFGERIRASAFHLELCDAGTVAAVQDRRLPIPTPKIIGSVEGDFDFELERGQAGQPFP